MKKSVSALIVGFDIYKPLIP